MEFGLGVRENPGVYGCNNLSYSGTFSVILTARGFFTRFGFSMYILYCDCFILSHLFFLLIDIIICYELWAYIRHGDSAFIGI